MPTYSLRELKREQRRQLILEDTNEDSETLPVWRPKTYGDCQKLPRPCPFVGCRYHLYLDSSKGSLHTLAGEPDQIPQTCALDVANEGAKTLEEVGALLGVTRERIRQIEQMALRSLARNSPTELRKTLEGLNEVSQTGYHLHRASSCSDIRKAEDDVAGGPVSSENLNSEGADAA